MTREGGFWRLQLRTSCSARAWARSASWPGSRRLALRRSSSTGFASTGSSPSRFAPLVGGGLIAAELVLGVLLVSGLAPVLAAAGAIALFTAFAVALGVSLARSNTAPCHCFGASEVERISPLALVRALALAGVAVAVLVFALGDTAGIAREDLTAALLMTAGFVTVTRLSGLFPLAWSFLRAEASMYPTPTRRVSFKHQPLHVPLFPEEWRQ